eukprot:13026774-Alexandrium_andersonii.AAC.1
MNTLTSAGLVVLGDSKVRVRSAGALQRISELAGDGPAGPQGPVGPVGAQGPQGPIGPAGAEGP